MNSMAAYNAAYQTRNNMAADNDIYRLVAYKVINSLVCNAAFNAIATHNAAYNAIDTITAYNAASNAAYKITNSPTAFYVTIFCQKPTCMRHFICESGAYMSTKKSGTLTNNFYFTLFFSWKF